MWTLSGCLGAVLGDVRRLLDEVPPFRACSQPTPDPASDPAPSPTPATDAPPATVPPPEPALDEPPTRWADPPGPAPSPDEPLPPGPWRWRWMWPAPGRPGGMALVAADETLVLWSPGGFAGRDTPPDGRPTPEVAVALASLPDLAEAAASAETLRAELDRALATAMDARQLLHRAAHAVDDAIDRRETDDVADT
jgi:hypothetical protein